MRQHRHLGARVAVCESVGAEPPGHREGVLRRRTPAKDADEWREVAIQLRQVFDLLGQDPQLGVSCGDCREESLALRHARSLLASNPLLLLPPTTSEDCTLRICRHIHTKRPACTTMHSPVTLKVPSQHGWRQGWPHTPRQEEEHCEQSVQHVLLQSTAATWWPADTSRL